MYFVLKVLHYMVLFSSCLHEILYKIICYVKKSSIIVLFPNILTHIYLKKFTPKFFYHINFMIILYNYITFSSYSTVPISKSLKYKSALIAA